MVAANSILADFGLNLRTHLVQITGLWAGGLLWYLLLGSLVTILALRKQGSWTWTDWLKRIFPPDYYRDPTARITALHFLLFLVFWGPLIALLTVSPPAASEVVAVWLAKTFGDRPAIIHAPALVTAVQGIPIVLAMSFASFACHYAAHRVPLLWSFHRAHHSVEALTLPATARDHPIDLLLIKLTMIVLAGIVGGGVLYWTGTHIQPGTFLVVGAVTIGYFTFFGVFNHSHIPISLGWANRIVMAPVMHQVHHSAELRHRDKNIGSFGGLMIWDWMFGTLYLPAKDEDYRWGLDAAEMGERNPHRRLRDFYLEPFGDAWNVVRTALG